MIERQYERSCSFTRLTPTVQPPKLRKTTQLLIPEKGSPTSPGKYNIYPGFPIGGGKIKTGSRSLAEWISQYKTVIIDGYVGVLWDNFVANIDEGLARMGKKALWFHVDAALRSAQEIDKMLEPYLGGDDPVLGNYRQATFRLV